MGSIATKAFNNVYYQARLEAQKYDDVFKSRERTSELLGIAPCTLADYELGNVKVMPRDIVIAMAKLYKAPYLLNHYCACECPIGQTQGKEMPVNRNIEQTAFTLMKASSSMGKAVNDLIEVVSDGVITSDEVETLNGVIELLSVFAKLRDELEIKLKKVSG